LRPFLKNPFGKRPWCQEKQIIILSRLLMYIIFSEAIDHGQDLPAIEGASIILKKSGKWGLHDSKGLRDRRGLWN
jgi:hypothetical protein